MQPMPSPSWILSRSSTTTSRCLLRHGSSPKLANPRLMDQVATCRDVFTRAARSRLRVKDALATETKIRPLLHRETEPRYRFIPNNRSLICCAPLATLFGDCTKRNKQQTWTQRSPMQIRRDAFVQDSGMDVARPSTLLRPLTVTGKTMMGPGPSNCSPRVLHALSQPVIGHLHKETFEIMDDIKMGLKYIFQTRNALTLAVSATGHGGMEAALCNLTEPGDKVLVAVNGFWGQRALDVASRHGAIVRTVEVEEGKNFDLCAVEKAISTHEPNLFFITQGESSTGVYQPIAGIGEICRKHDCLLIVDAVASLGGVEVLTDKWLVDCIYTGSQKVLGAPPGLAPISFSERSLKKIRGRKTPVSVYYFDMNLLGRYWDCYPGESRIYHHTISATLLYGLREGLAQIVEEGIQECIARHRDSCRVLHDGLNRLGFEFFVPDENARLPTVTTIKVRSGFNWQRLMDLCLNRYHVEISGGLGPTVGKVLRIGVMGRNANVRTVQFTLKALEDVLNKCNSKL